MAVKDKNKNGQKKNKQEPVQTIRLRVLESHPELTDDMLRVPGFPIVPSGDRVIIIPILQANLVSPGGIITVESRDNKSRIAKIMAISPELYNTARHPFFSYRPGDVVYFNHLAGNHMRLMFNGTFDDVYVMYIMDILGEFVGDQEVYFGKQLESGFTSQEMLKSVGATDIEDDKHPVEVVIGGIKTGLHDWPDAPGDAPDSE